MGEYELSPYKISPNYEQKLQVLNSLEENKNQFAKRDGFIPD